MKSPYKVIVRKGMPFGKAPLFSIVDMSTDGLSGPWMWECPCCDRHRSKWRGRAWSHRGAIEQADRHAKTFAHQDATAKIREWERHALRAISSPQYIPDVPQYLPEVLRPRWW